MRKAFLACLLFLFAVAAFSSAPSSYAANPASNASPVGLTPEQARQALDVLGNPKRRAQIEDTLRAVAAAGALSAPPASAAAPASAAQPASGASGTLAAAFQVNGLASQLSHQVVHGVADVSDSLTHSTVVLLDVSSARAWWGAEMGSPQGRARLTRVTWTVLATLAPALLLGALARRALKRPVDALAARNADEGAAAQAQDGEASREQAQAQAPTPGANATDDKAGHTDSERHAAHAARHWSLLQRLPQAVLHTVLEALPIVVFAVVAIALMSMLAGVGSPEASVLDALIVIYTISRAIVLLGRFFFAPRAPGLRLVRMSDTSAAFAQRWVVRIVTILGIGVAIAVAPLSLGLAHEAHLAILKAVSLVGHALIAVVILQCRRPVAELIRAWSGRSRSLAIVGDWLADVWAGVAVFFVMALWFVWALDVRNGYHILLHRGGISVAVLIGARLAAIVCFGVLGHLFHVKDAEQDSIAYQHAYRYYPLLRRVVSAVLLLVTAGLVLRVWGVDASRVFSAGSVGDRLMSALVTIAIAAGLALFVWEAVNVMIERRLDRWTANADFVRAARLRTLLPMLRTALFVIIALVVVLTGLSELGVNTAPLLAGASIFGVALGFGSQKLVQDFITGMFLLMENAMQVGDWVTLAGVSGTVEYLSIRTVRLRGGDGSLYTVPFSSVSTVNNTNRGLGNAAVKVSIAYGQDVDLAVTTLKEIGAALRSDDKFKDGILSDFSYWGVDQVDGAMVTLAGQIQCRDTARWSVQREFNRRILEQFETRGIAMANPQRSFLVQDGGGRPQPAPAGAATHVQGKAPDA